MATMYVYNIPTDETVNLRKTASADRDIELVNGEHILLDAQTHETTE